MNSNWWIKFFSSLTFCEVPWSYISTDLSAGKNTAFCGDSFLHIDAIIIIPTHGTSAPILSGVKLDKNVHRKVIYTQASTYTGKSFVLFNDMLSVNTSAIIYDHFLFLLWKSAPSISHFANRLPSALIGLWLWHFAIYSYIKCRHFMSSCT